jgi:hypothetical protein
VRSAGRGAEQFRARPHARTANGLLPAPDPKEALVVADGFSCRCQIEQGTDRRALHLAEVLQLAARSEGHARPRDYPEAGSVQARPPALSKPAAVAVLAGGLLVAGGLGRMAWRKLAGPGA